MTGYSQAAAVLSASDRSWRASVHTYLLIDTPLLISVANFISVFLQTTAMISSDLLMSGRGS